MAELAPEWQNEKIELVLYADNEAALYDKKKAIIASVKTKIERGIYDKTKAPKLWQVWVDQAARRYCKEFQCDIIRTFPIKVRQAAAEEIAQREYKAIKDGEYGALNIKPRKVKLPKIELTRLRVNREGYLSSGEYRGVGGPLFSAYNPDSGETVELRAPDRKTALEVIRRMFSDRNHQSVRERFNDWQVDQFIGRAKEVAEALRELGRERRR